MDTFPFPALIGYYLHNVAIRNIRPDNRQSRGTRAGKQWTGGTDFLIIFFIYNQ